MHLVGWLVGRLTSYLGVRIIVELEIWQDTKVFLAFICTCNIPNHKRHCSYFLTSVSRRSLIIVYCLTPASALARN